MKRGPNNTIKIYDIHPNKQQKTNDTIIRKPLTEPLQEVSNGDNTNFCLFPAQNNKQELNLSIPHAHDIHLQHLGQAIKGTNVTDLNLADFDKQFSKRGSWVDDLSSADSIKFLKSFYPLFYKDDSDAPDYEAIRSELKKLTSIKQSTQEQPKQARELIKNLFRIPYKCINEMECKQSAVLNTLKDSFGHRIIAHGVEEAKGGLSNILLMLVSNKVLAACSNWGAFLDGPPNASPLCHGPYYLIYSTQDKSPPSNPSFSDIEYILVPFPQHIKFLQEKVESMVAVNLVTKCEQKSFSYRLMDYQGFLNLLKYLESEKAPAKYLEGKKKCIGDKPVVIENNAGLFFNTKVRMKSSLDKLEQENTHANGANPKPVNSESTILSRKNTAKKRKQGIY